MPMYTPDYQSHNRVQVKICGLTSPEDALACVSFGADAIGLVFYPKSPRYVTTRQAARIASVLQPNVGAVGVFVDTPLDTVLTTAPDCRLSAVQLHGAETPAFVAQVRQAGLSVIKGLYLNGDPNIRSAAEYADAIAFLVECAAGKMPGGNAMAWDWRGARDFGGRYPIILAGGLKPESVGEAITAANPDAVDVSSGVEASPGRKDPNRVRDFIRAACAAPVSHPKRRIFS